MLNSKLAPTWFTNVKVIEITSDPGVSGTGPFYLTLLLKQLHFDFHWKKELNGLLTNLGQQAFEKLKDLVTKSPMLKFFYPSLLIKVTSDASQQPRSNLRTVS